MTFYLCWLISKNTFAPPLKNNLSADIAYFFRSWGYINMPHSAPWCYVEMWCDGTLSTVAVIALCINILPSFTFKFCCSKWLSLFVSFHQLHRAPWRWDTSAMDVRSGGPLQPLQSRIKTAGKTLKSFSDKNHNKFPLHSPRWIALMLPSAIDVWRVRHFINNVRIKALFKQVIVMKRLEN